MVKIRDMKPFVSIFAFLCIFISTINAQEDSTKKEKVQFKIGVYYNSGLNYYGRTDSLRSSGFFPLAELWFGKGFYLNAAPVFVHNAVTSFEYAGSVATLGYRFTNE